MTDLATFLRPRSNSEVVLLVNFIGPLDVPKLTIHQLDSVDRLNTTLSQITEQHFDPADGYHPLIHIHRTTAESVMINLYEEEDVELSAVPQVTANLWIDIITREPEIIDLEQIREYVSSLY